MVYYLIFHLLCGVTAIIVALYDEKKSGGYTTYGEAVFPSFCFLVLGPLISVCVLIFYIVNMKFWGKHIL